MTRYRQANTASPDTFGYERGPDGGAYYKNLRIQTYPETHIHIARKLVEQFPDRGRLLDVASGTGSLAERLLDLGFEVHCTTWNEKLRVNAPTYHLDLDYPFRVGDVGGRLFNVIVASEIIEHVENPSLLLRSCASALAPDGLLIVTTPNVADVASRLQWFFRGCPDIFSSAEVLHNRHISMIWQAGFEHLAHVAGLQICEWRMLGSHAGLPLHKRVIYRVLAHMFGPTSAGVSCVFVLRLSPDGPQPHGSDATY
jgi:SAM-dependent methyltransferase